MCRKVNFTEIPDWVGWIAKDASGIWWGYQVEPNLSHLSWYENEVGNSVNLGLGSKDDDLLLTLKRIK